MNKGKYFAITTILLLILCLTVAYTSYSATISTNGTSSITNDWNLFFKKVESTFNENSNSNPNQPSITNNRQTIKLYPEINTPNSEIIYNITIENNGLIDAIAEKDFIIWNLEKDSPNIHYEVTYPGNIKKGEEVTFKVRFYTNDTITEELNTNNEILTGTLNYTHADK